MDSASADLREALSILESTEQADRWSDAYFEVRQHLTTNFNAAEVERVVVVLIRGLLAENTNDAFNCAWALTNVTCADESYNTECLVAAGGIEALGSLLHRTREPRVQHQCLWALGNIACENDLLAARVVLLVDPIPVAINLLETTCWRPTFRKQTAWFLHRTLKFGTDMMTLWDAEEAAKVLIDVLMDIFSKEARSDDNTTRKSEDSTMKTELMHSLLHLVDVFQSDVVTTVMYHREFTVNLMHVLHAQNPSVNRRFRKMAMQLIGNLVLGDDSDVESLYGMNLLDFLYEQLRKHQKPSELIEIIWIYSNLAATNEALVRELFAGFRGVLVADTIAMAFSAGDQLLEKEALFAAQNTLLMFSSEPDHLKFFLDRGFFVSVVFPFIHRLEKFIELTLEVIEQCLGDAEFRHRCLLYNVDKELENCLPWIEHRLPLLRNEAAEVLDSLQRHRKEKTANVFCAQRKRAKVKYQCPFPDPYKQTIQFITDEFDCMEV